jgi:hypothetical protein
MIEAEVHDNDGYIGKVEDCYFDAIEWAVRYWVVDITDTIIDRKILVAPLSIRKIDWGGKQIYLDLSRREIENSPAYNDELPVSRQYQISLHRYYEWPEYWGETSFIDSMQAKKYSLPHFPTTESTDPSETMIPQSEENSEEEPSLPFDEREDVYNDERAREMEFGDPERESTSQQELHSVREMQGYRLVCTDSACGTVADICLDERAFAIRYLVVDTKYYGKGKQVLVPSNWCRGLLYETSEMQVELSRLAIVSAPAYDGSDPVNKKYEESLFEHIDSTEVL